MQDQTIKLGIIGCGDVATNKQWHIPSLKALNDPDAKLVALADKIPGLAQKTADRFSVPLAYDDYHLMLENPSINAVSVCTRTNVHKQIAMDVLKAGKHVFVEKPITSTYEELVELSKFAQSCGKIFVAGSNGLHLHQMKYFKDIIDSGTMGEIYLINIERVYGRPWNSSLTSPPKVRDGVATHNASHSIEWVLYFLGDPKAVSVTAKGFGIFDNISRPFEKREEDDSGCIAQIVFDNSAVFQYKGIVKAPVRSSYVVKIIGDKMSIEYDVDKCYKDEQDDCITLFRHSELMGMEESHPAIQCERGHGPLYRYFFSCIRENRLEVSRCERGIETMRILDAILESQKKGGRQVLL